MGNNDQTYRLNFSLGNFPGLSVVSEEITIQPCLPQAHKYAVTLTTQCIDCPDHAICNGALPPPIPTPTTAITTRSYLSSFAAARALTRSLLYEPSDMGSEIYGPFLSRDSRCRLLALYCTVLHHNSAQLPAI